MISSDGKAKLVLQLKRHEGLKLSPYRDSVGVLTIGYGRNLDAVGIYPDEADFLLEHDVQRMIGQLEGLAWFDGLSEARRLAIVNMAFNMGLAGVLGFKKMLAAIEASDWEVVAKEALESKWATQVGGRARELADILKTGVMT